MRGSVRERRGWIASPGYDLGLITIAPLLGLLVVVGAWLTSERALVESHFVEIAFFLVGMPHYLSTYTFFLGDENREHYSRRRFAFFAGPVLVIALLTISLAAHFYRLVTLVVDTWNVFHVCRQSAGILSIYRHMNGGDNSAEKTPANLAILLISGSLYCLTVDRQDSLSYVFALFPVDISPFVSPVLMVSGGCALLVLLIRMRRRLTRVSISESLFLGTSIALFAPYIFLQTRPLASSAMLIGHYVQYMGVLWLLNHRKYGSPAGSVWQRGLAIVSEKPLTIVISLVAIGCAMFVIDRGVHYYSADALHTWWLNAVVLLHFYFDGLFWAFKDGYVRKSVGPYFLAPQMASV